MGKESEENSPGTPRRSWRVSGKGEGKEERGWRDEIEKSEGNSPGTPRRSWRLPGRREGKAGLI